MTPLQGVGFMFRGVTAGLVFTGPALWLLQRYGVPANVFLAPVALLLAMFAERVPGWALAVLRWRLGVPKDGK